MPRRRVLAGVSFASIALAGCLESDDAEEAPAEPLSLDDGQSCDVCGMVIADHHGPAGQLFYTDGYPDSRDGPAWFDSVVELLTYHDARLEEGRELREAFVTDYSTVEYEVIDRDGTAYLSTHVGATDFADATAVDYVVDSGVEGAMGADFIPFSATEDADAFTDAYGGEVRSWDELPSPTGE